MLCISWEATRVHAPFSRRPPRCPPHIPPFIPPDLNLIRPGEFIIYLLSVMHMLDLLLGSFVLHMLDLLHAVPGMAVSSMTMPWRLLDGYGPSQIAFG